MLRSLSLRLRIFLFFCLLAIGAIALAAVALGFVWTRTDSEWTASELTTVILLFGFLNTGLVLGIWLLFDENVARPIEGLSTSLRLRAHSGIEDSIKAQAAQYLGDLAPAARALSDALAASGDQPPEQTQRLLQERERLTVLLSEIPIATILVNAAGEIALYDAQAGAILSRIAAPRLGAPLSNYFDLTPAIGACARADRRLVEGHVTVPDCNHAETFNLQIKSLGAEGDVIFLDADTRAERDTQSRPLVFNFDLLDQKLEGTITARRLSELNFVVFDTETTGLSVAKDAIVELAAARVLNGRILDGEVFETYVDPGRPIPAASTKIHGVRDADVAQSPRIEEVIPAFHDFAQSAVLVAHNAPFDIGLLRQQEVQTGCSWDHPVVDTVLLSALVFGISADHSLDALCSRLSIEIPARHRHTAKGDARATAEALIRLLPLLQGKGIETFGQLLNETSKFGRLLRDINSDHVRNAPEMSDSP